MVQSTLAAETLSLTDGCNNSFFISKLMKQILHAQNGYHFYHWQEKLNPLNANPQNDQHAQTIV